MQREDLIKITDNMQQIKKLATLGVHVCIDRNDMEVMLSFNDEFLKAAEDLKQKVECKNRYFDSEAYLYEWSFGYNGVKFFTLSNEVYRDAETTTREEQMQSGDA